MEIDLQHDDALTAQAKLKGIHTWQQLLLYIRDLPYGRNQNRADISLVLQEEKGTCSSKHAFLKRVAELNGIPNVQLILGMYRMSQKNTPGIGQVLSDHGIAFIPEAHCYLKINNKRVDVTSSSSSFQRIANDLIQEFEISPGDVTQKKVLYHQQFIREWLLSSEVNYSFEEVWKIREQCISNLGVSHTSP